MQFGDLEKMISLTIRKPAVRAQPQVTVQTAADIVAVQDITAGAHVEQAFLQSMGQGGFPAAGKAGEPDKRASVAV